MKNATLNFIVGFLFFGATIAIYFDQNDVSNNILLVCTPTFLGALIFIGFGIYYRCKKR